MISYANSLFFDSLLYHTTLISLNRHFIKPTPGFEANTLSKETCIASSNSVVALIREFRAQHSLSQSPIILVYSAVMAASGIFFTHESIPPLDEKDRRLTFILKVLEDCSSIHDIAREAKAKLQTNIDARRHLALKSSASESTPAFDSENLNAILKIPPMSWSDSDLFNLHTFDLDAFDLDAFDLAR